MHVFNCYLLYCQYLNMKQSRRGVDSFQSELQHKLNSLTQTKSHKKIKIKHALEQPNYKYELDQYSHISPNTESDDNRGSLISEHPNLNRDKQNKQKNTVHVDEVIKKSGKKQIVVDLDEVPKPSKKSALDLVENQQLRTFLEINFGQKCGNLDLSYFLAKCLAKFSHQPSLPEQQIKIIFLDLQRQITTTDPNSISLNALELAIKKSYGSFQLYMGTKIIGSQQQLISRKLKQREKVLEKMGNQSHRETESKERQLQQVQKSLCEREKQVLKKQKLLQNKQKQFMERIKNHKKMLEERAQKLGEEHVSKLEAVCEKIEKKITTYERNMKYRVESINHKINQIHHLRQFKEGEIRSSVVKEVDEKYDKVYSNKLRKYESQHKELVEKCEVLRKQCKQLEQENNKLASIISKLQAKVMREDAKIKELLQESGAKKQEIKQLQYLCTEKQKQNEKLIKRMMAYKEEEGDGNGKSQGHQKMKVSCSNKSLSSKKKLNKGDTVDVECAIDQIQLKQVIQVYEGTLHAINSGRNHEIGQQIVAKSLMLIVRIISYSNLSCQFLLDIAFQSVTRKACGPINKTDTKQRKGSKSMIKSTHLSQLEPKLSQQMLKYLKAMKKQKKQHQHKYAWKLWSIMYILSSNNSNNNYLNFIYNQSQNSSIFGEMEAKIINSEYNFIYAIIVKYITEIREENLEMELSALTLITDMVLDFKVVGEAKFDKFWKLVGLQVIQCFLALVKCTINDSKYFHESYDAIEKISIMVQRLVVAHQLSPPNQGFTIFQALAKKCRGSLLERNLNSILETVWNGSLLGEVEKE